MYLRIEFTSSSTYTGNVQSIALPHTHLAYTIIPNSPATVMISQDRVDYLVGTLIGIIRGWKFSSWSSGARRSRRKCGCRHRGLNCRKFGYGRSCGRYVRRWSCRRSRDGSGGGPGIGAHRILTVAIPIERTTVGRGPLPNADNAQSVVGTLRAVRARVIDRRSEALPHHAVTKPPLEAYVRVRRGRAVRVAGARVVGARARVSNGGRCAEEQQKTSDGHPDFDCRHHIERGCPKMMFTVIFLRCEVDVIVKLLCKPKKL